MNDVNTAGASRGSLRSYATGYLLSIVSTSLSFGMVMLFGAPRGGVVGALFALAVAQMLVHVRYFLHLSGKSERRWDLAAFVVTLLIVILIVGGSIWIMGNLMDNLMPPSGM